MKTPYITKAQAYYEVKSLKKLVNKGQLEFTKQLKQAEEVLKALQANDSFLKPSRNAFKACSSVRFEQVQ